MLDDLFTSGFDDVNHDLGVLDPVVSQQSSFAPTIFCTSALSYEVTANDKLSTFTVDHDNGITTVINNSTVTDEMTFTAEFTAKIVINGTDFASKAFTFNVIVDKCKEDTQTAFYSTTDIDI